MIDVQRQLEGTSPIKYEPGSSVEQFALVERAYVIDALFIFATSSPAEECCRRSTAISTLVALCDLREGWRARKWPAEPRVKAESDDRPALSPITSNLKRKRGGSRRVKSGRGVGVEE